MGTEIEIQGVSLLLLAERAIFWPERELLLISDAHFGKVTHFRKAGIGIPPSAAHHNLQRFENLLIKTGARAVIFLGDLFHSELNSEWLTFKACLRRHPSVHFTLVGGNHDILHPQSYANLQLTVKEEPYALNPFLLSHYPWENSESYNLCGHLHPGVRLTGSGRQSLRLPCFFFGKAQGVLPAFGEFTGLHLMRPRAGDKVFVLVDGKLLAVH